VWTGSTNIYPIREFLLAHFAKPKLPRWLREMCSGTLQSDEPKKRPPRSKSRKGSGARLPMVAPRRDRRWASGLTVQTIFGNRSSGTGALSIERTVRAGDSRGKFFGRKERPGPLGQPDCVHSLEMRISARGTIWLSRGPRRVKRLKIRAVCQVNRLRVGKNSRHALNHGLMARQENHL